MRVLIVEDDVKLAGLIQRALREQAALADAAHDGEDALWMADATPYDVMMLDINLPGINGFETCQQLRASRVHSGGNPLRWRVTLLSRSGRGDLRSSAPECSYLPRLRSAATIVIRNLRDLADNPEDFGSCVDAIELVSH